MPIVFVGIHMLGATVLLAAVVWLVVAGSPRREPDVVGVGGWFGGMREQQLHGGRRDLPIAVIGVHPLGGAELVATVVWRVGI